MPSTDNKHKDKLLRSLNVLPWIALVLALTAAVGLHVSWWLFDIYVSFTPQIVIFLTTFYLLIFTLFARFIVRDGWSTSWAVVSSISQFVLLLSFIIYLYVFGYSLLIVSPAGTTEESPNLTVGTFNVLYSNDSINEAANYFHSKNTDIVAFQEVSPEFVEEARDTLNYNYSEITDCDCGAESSEVALVSRYPLANTSTIIEHENGAVLRTEVQLPEGDVIPVYAIHIPPPVSSQWHGLRDDFIARLEMLVIDEEQDPIVMGDFNTTIFSPSMQDFINATDTKVKNIADSAWPTCSWYGYTALACARIDHIFVPTSYDIGERFTGELFYGSDHKPVIAELKIN